MDLLSALEEETFSSDKVLTAEQLWKVYEEDAPEIAAMDTETTGLKWFLPHVRAFAMTISWSKKKTFYLALPEGDDDELKRCAETIYKIFLTTPVLVFHNAGFDLHILNKLFKRFGLPMVTRRVDDTMLLHYCLDEQAFHGLKPISSALGISYDRNVDAEALREKIDQWLKDQTENQGREVGWDEVPLYLMVPYAIQDAYITLELFRHLTKQMAEQMAQIPEARPRKDVQDIYELEMDYLWVVFSQTERGMRIDLDLVIEQIAELQPMLEHARDRMKTLLGWDMNPGSTEDVAAALKQFGADESAWTNPRTGRPKLPEWVLDDIIKFDQYTQDQKSVAQAVLDYRGAQKLVTSYFEALLEGHVLDEDGQAIVHPNVKQHGARTGRQSITDPPLQTLPKKGKVRAAFIARQGHTLIFADYSQQELRVLAHYASAIGDHSITEIYLKNGDIHWETAESVYGKPREELDKDVHRDAAKSVNFGTIYGMGVEKAAKLLAQGNVQRGRMFLSAYHRKFPAIRRLKSMTQKGMEARGYIVTVFGRRHRIGDGKTSYKSVNSLIQGTSADQIKTVMVRIDRRFQVEAMSARIVLSIHDEILVEAPDHEVEIAVTILHEEMANFPELLCPMVADVKTGTRWSEAG